MSEKPANLDLLKIARELEAIAQSGLHYTSNDFEKERYARVREIAAEIHASYSNLKVTDILEWTKPEFGYATPKIDVRGFILKDDKVLLIRENLDHGRWTLPGGYADVNESPSQNVIREIREESGYIAKVERLLAVLDRDSQGHTPPWPFHIYKLFFHCTITGGKPTANLESSECGFFDVHDLPELSQGRALPHEIVRLHKMVTEADPHIWHD